MKTNLGTLLQIVLIAAFSVASPSCLRKTPRDNATGNRHIVFGLSPALASEDKEVAWNELSAFALNNLRVGEIMDICDALHLNRIARCELPADPSLSSSERARIRLLGPQLNLLRTWLHQSDSNVEAGVAAPILEPEFLRLCSTQLKQPAKPMTVVLIGSALYWNPSDHAWDFVGGYWPSDGHLQAVPGTSPFTVKEQAEALHEVTLHHAYLRDSFANEPQRAGVTRFWTLFVSQQGGVLAGFAADLRLVLEGVRDGRAQPIAVITPDPSDTKPEMRRRTVEPLRADAVTPAAFRSTSAEMPIEKEQIILSEQPIAPATGTLSDPRVREFNIGARWRGSLDIDIFGSAKPGTKELFYGRQRTPEGAHVKDFLSAPPGSQGYETIYFTQAVDVREVTASLNFYNGNAAGGVDVTVRVWCDGHTWTKICHIPASSGNQGGNSAHRSSDEHWMTIDVTSILGLKE